MAQFYNNPAEAEAAFYHAFRNLDMTGMQRVWADFPTVYCIHPSGRLFIGYEAVMQSWSGIFQGVVKPQIDYSLSNATKHTDLAIHLVEEKIRSKATPLDSHSVVLATNVFQLTDKGWRLLSHHASQSLSSPTSSGTPALVH